MSDITSSTATPVQDDLTSPSAQTISKIIHSRRGDVLGYSTIVKSDHFPGCQRMSLLPHLPGAPNFRQIPGCQVYGVAIPTVLGMTSVLHHLGVQPHSQDKKVLWISLREGKLE